jgi:hypothetical protein
VLLGHEIILKLNGTSFVRHEKLDLDVIEEFLLVAACILARSY